MFFGMTLCGICVIVIFVCAGLLVPNKIVIRKQTEHKRTFAVPIVVDNFLKQIGYTQNISEPAYKTAPFGKDHLVPLWELTHKALDLKNLKERLQILPIKCFTGSEGMFPTKYEKLFQSLAEYATFHSEVSDAHQLIWKCDIAHGYCQGLADRLRGIAYTLLLAVFSRRRLLLSWKMPYGEHIFFKPNLINWATDDTNTESTATFRLMNNMSTKSIPAAMNAIGSNLTKVAISTNLELEAVNKQILRPQWLIDGMKRTGLDVLTNKDINEIFGIAFRYLFQMGKDLSLAVNSAEHLLGLDKKKYVAVHVRAGFAGSAHPEKRRVAKILREREQWEQMLLCAVSMANVNVGSDSLIFLATDSKIVKDLAARMYGSRFKTLNVTLTHTRRIELNIASIEGLLSSLVDFFLLAQSYVIVKAGSDWINGSGFSIGASQLCGIPGGQRIDGRENCTPEDKLVPS